MKKENSRFSPKLLIGSLFFSFAVHFLFLFCCIYYLGKGSSEKKWLVTSWNEKKVALSFSKELPGVSFKTFPSIHRKASFEEEKLFFLEKLYPEGLPEKAFFALYPLERKELKSLEKKEFFSFAFQNEPALFLEQKNLIFQEKQKEFVKSFSLQKSYSFPKQESFLQPIAFSTGKREKKLIGVQGLFPIDKKAFASFSPPVQENSFSGKSLFSSEFLLPHLHELKTARCGRDFDMELSYIPKENQEGYIFALTLIPRSEFDFPPLRQNFFFFFDASNSIQRERFMATRHAISGALSLMSKEDRFNIFVFDNKLSRLSEKNLSPNAESFAKAKSFLVKQELGSFFSSTNFSLPFSKALEEVEREKELCTIIFLSNGEGVQKSKNYRMLQEWTKKSPNALSLFVVTLEEDKNLPFLEMFSYWNRGKLFSSSTHRGLKRKLVKVLETVKHPVAMGVESHALCKEEKAKIFLSPPLGQLPHLYLHQPYVLLGEIDTLEDFVLFLQGKQQDHWINIRKDISFRGAKEGGKELRKEWALHSSYELYEKYLIEGKQEYLREAKKILEPFGIFPFF